MAPWQHVQEHCKYDEDGNKVSQWVIDCESMRAFFSGDGWQKLDAE